MALAFMISNIAC